MSELHPKGLWLEAKHWQPFSLTTLAATHVVDAYDIAMALSTYTDALSVLSRLVPLCLVAKYIHSTWRTEILGELEENRWY